MLRLESTILKNLIYHEAYMRKVIPFLKVEYFKEPSERTVFTEVHLFVEKYKNLPTHEALVINLTESKGLKEEEIRDGVELLMEIAADTINPTDIPWLSEQTEKFCKDAALYNAVLEVVSILDDSKDSAKKKPKEACPAILTEALSVSFDPHVGHDYMMQSDDRFDFYHRKEMKIPFDIHMLNQITGGGFSIKTLNVLLGGVGVGKTLVMCHLAASYLSMGFNVLYITLEMAEERIAERIDANLLNIDLNTLETLTREEYNKKFQGLRSKTHGKLMIKEYPTAGASTLHFRALINELALKKQFKADVIIIDYLNICASSRVRQGGNVNSYTYVKSIAEEIRGLAVENRVPIISATQTTRAGLDSSDLDMSDTSESIGLPATCDFFAALVESEELEKLNQYMFKQLKNRYRNKNINKRFVIGVDKPKMRLYDAAPSAQENLMPDPKGDDKDRKPFERPKRNLDFSNFKV